jgi:nitrogen fixation/metabolism regulation signal transduction histidine kinase
LGSYHRFGWGVAARAGSIGLLTCGIGYLLLVTELYAGAVTLLLLAVAIAFDLARLVARADRSMESAAEAVLFGESQRPARDSRVFSRCLTLLERAATTAAAARFEQQQRISRLQALLDTVSTALVVVHGNGHMSAQNASARELLGAATGMLELRPEHADHPTAGGGRFAGLRAGTRQLVQLPDGRRLLASAAEFSTPGREPQLLVSLQRIAGELDAVELLAWQDMSRVLTHEIMNSLTPIASLSESLETLLQTRHTGSAQMEEVTTALEVIRRRSLGLMSFVERYRQVAELPQPRLASVHAVDLLIGIDKLMSARFKALGITYRSDVIPANLSLIGDSQLLEQALINLLSNACDAVASCPQPQIEVRCELHGPRVLLAVRDNGVGLPSQGAEQIFVPFFTTKPDGSGIGLSLARRIAVAHGGTLDVQTLQPRGVLMLMNLPQGAAS